MIDIEVLYDEEIPEILLPKVDFIFKLLFGDERNKDILADFLSAVLGFEDGEIDENAIQIVDPHQKRMYANDKLEILDVKLKLGNEKVINIELQVNELDEMRDRIIYYISDMIVCQLRKGDNYELTPVVSIVITDYELLKETRKYHNQIGLYEKDERFLFSDLLTIHTLELPKFPKTQDGKLENWLEFMKAKKREEFMAIAKKSPYINRAFKVLEDVSADENTRELYKARLKNWRDAAARESFVEKRGIQKGRTETAKELFTLWESGVSLSEAKRKFALA